MLLDNGHAGRDFLFLERVIPIDAACLIMSFLHYTDLQAMSLCSSHLYHVVSYAHYVYMEEAFEPQARVTRQPNPNNTDLQQPSYLVKRPARLNHRSLTNLLGRYSNLKELHLAGLGPVGDSLLRLLNEAPAAPNLRSLTLHGASLTYWCPGVLQLPRLENLKVAGGSIRASLALILGHTTRLKSLSFAQCSALRDDHLRQLLAPLDESLKELSVHQCLRIKRPRIDSSRLEKLSFMGCFALTELPDLFAPTLRELNLSFCFRLDRIQIHNIMDSLPNLESLKLVKCPLLDRLDVQSLPALSFLNVNYCNALSSVRVSGSPLLAVLECNGCISLQTLILDGADALEYLNISTLPIRRLLVTAVRLLHLEMENCRHLDDCLIRSPNLQSVNVRGSRTVALRFCKQVRNVLLEKHWMCRTPMEI